MSNRIANDSCVTSGLVDDAIICQGIWSIQAMIIITWKCNNKSHCVRQYIQLASRSSPLCSPVKAEEHLLFLVGKFSDFVGWDKSLLVTSASKLFASGTSVPEKTESLFSQPASCSSCFARNQSLAKLALCFPLVLG